MNRKTKIQKRKQIPDRHQKNLQIAVRLLPFFHHQPSIGIYIPVRGEADGFGLLVATLADFALTSQDSQTMTKGENAGFDLSLRELEILADLKQNPPLLFAPKVISKTEMEMYPLFSKHRVEKDQQTRRDGRTLDQDPFHQPAMLSSSPAKWALDLAEDLLLEPGGFGLLEPAVKTYDLEAGIPKTLVIPLLAFQDGFRLGYGGGYYDRYLAKHPECIRVGIAYDEQEEPFIFNPWDERLDYIVTPTRVLHYPRGKTKRQTPI
ncbi:hypothetical protein IM774_05970 [Erysipelotrichaceae bacterium RD49]|nr:hypothetical protein [Erysipelotrichaceae bacterium RD49]